MAKLDPLSTDIYAITDSVVDLQKEIYTGLDSSTLSVGINGYTAAMFSTQLQNAIIVASELGNEIFPAKAKFDKNIIAHAIIQNITDVNATPAIMPILIGMSLDDIDASMERDTFRFDRTTKIYINNIEFHFQYDIILTRNLNVNNVMVYSARYDMSKKNPLSDITNPYLDVPFIQYYGGQPYLFIRCDLLQVKLLSVQSKIITSTPIENKVFEFTYDEQLAGFSIKVTDGDKVKYLTPIFEGIGVDQTLSDYCFYSFIDLNNIRVTFDSASYVPELNAMVEAEIWTTLGSGGNFDYDTTQTIIFNISSDNYGYKNIPVNIMIIEGSSKGRDKKSIKELRQQIPKEALSRGSISNSTSLQNYFDIINTDDNRLIVQKKVDNQFERTFYSYLVLKDKYGNVMPTNTIDIRLDKGQFQRNFNKKFVLLPGTCIWYNPATGYGEVVDRESLGEFDDKEKFVYILPMMMVMTDDPLYISYYNTILSRTLYNDFTFNNIQCPVQFVAPAFKWTRKLMSDSNKYIMEIPLQQNVNTDHRMIVINSATSDVSEVNIRVFAVFYNSDDSNVPYRYAEAEIYDYDYSNFSYRFHLEVETTDQIDTKNRIRVENLMIPGTKDTAYGYVTSNMKCEVYVCARFNSQVYDDLRGLDHIVPDMTGFSVTNMFTVVNGVTFYSSYTDVIRSTVTHKKYQTDSLFKDGYVIKSVPLIRYSYADDEPSIQDFIAELDIKKAYIDHAKTVLENNFDMDLKFFNTYGPSKVYTIDREGEIPITRVNLTMNFRLKLVQSTDQYTKDLIIKDVKDIVEDLNDISSLHIPNLITTITNTYRNQVDYFEFLGFNDFGPGVQHLYHHDPERVDVVPEFLTIHTNEDKTPDINIVIG